MKEDKFIKENSIVWADLESILKKLKSKGIQKFAPRELDNFTNLYNRTCGHLSYCRTYYGNSNTTVYLNRLVASAHSYIYTTQSSNLKDLAKFLLIKFPLLLRQNVKYFILSLSIFFIGFLLSFVFTLISIDNASAFIPQSMVDSVNAQASNDSPRDWDNAIESTFILTNNIRVGFIAFALGITLGIGTLYILFYNGFPLGTLAALFYLKSNNLYFWSHILPHGVLELFAIFVCGAAGLIIGNALINPGVYSRKDALIMKVKLAIKLVCGTIPLFVIAGIIEGFVTPAASIPEPVKLLVASLTLVLLLFYMIFPNIKFKSKREELLK